MTDQAERAEFRAVPAEPPLAFLARQLERVLDRLGAIEDQITVLTVMAIRRDGSLAGLATEVRGLVRPVERTERRLRKLEDEADAGPPVTWTQGAHWRLWAPSAPRLGSAASRGWGLIACWADDGPAGQTLQVAEAATGIKPVSTARVILA